MQEKENHFIKNIEIKNFKCFEDFKAEGFGRVNLIGGKNNVGKTAFMEACYLSTSINILNYFLKHIEFLTNRDYVNQVYDFQYRDNDLNGLLNNSQSHITINQNTLTSYIINNEELTYDFYIKGEKYTEQYDQLFQFLNFNIKNTKQYFTTDFILASSSYPNFMFDFIISQLKSKLDKETSTFVFANLNSIISELFNYQGIDILQGVPTIFSKGQTFPLSHLGQGMKSFIYIIGSLLLVENTIVFIDEVENGLHHSKLDKLWEIILTISKQQNVQVFATTHSKECIESYTRVAKRLEDEEITFIDMGKNKDNEVKAIAMDSERFHREMNMDNEVRGW